MKLEYVIAIRGLAERAKEKRFNTLRLWINEPDYHYRLQSELREEIISACHFYRQEASERVLTVFSDDLKTLSIGIRKVGIRQIGHRVRTTNTHYTAQTVFRAIEKRLARPLFGSVRSATSSNDLGFMLREPIAVPATVPLVLCLPIWPWMVHRRSYHLKMDVIYNRYKDITVDPWIRVLKEEGERSLLGTIELSTQVAKDSVTSTLAREDQRYKRELDGKNKPMDPGAMQHLIIDYGNLVAAEAALAALVVHINEKA